MIVFDADNMTGQVHPPAAGRQAGRPGDEDLRRQVRQQAQAVSDLIRRLRQAEAGPKAIGIIRTIAGPAPADRAPRADAAPPIIQPARPPQPALAV